MLKMEDYIVIKTLKDKGVYLKDIAEELGVHPKTVSRALTREGAAEKKRKRRPSKLEPYKPIIDRLLSEGVWNAVVIMREIEAEGYAGLHHVATIHCAETSLASWESDGEI